MKTETTIKLIQLEELRTLLKNTIKNFKGNLIERELQIYSEVINKRYKKIFEGSRDVVLKYAKKQYNYDGINPPAYEPMTISNYKRTRKIIISTIQAHIDLIDIALKSLNK